jgi:hypothetical protein
VDGRDGEADCWEKRRPRRPGRDLQNKVAISPRPFIPAKGADSQCVPRTKGNLYGSWRDKPTGEKVSEQLNRLSTLRGAWMLRQAITSGQLPVVNPKPHIIRRVDLERFIDGLMSKPTQELSIRGDGSTLGA